MQNSKIYTKDNIQFVYQRFSYDPRSVVYTTDGREWKTPPMDTGKWFAGEVPDKPDTLWKFAFLEWDNKHQYMRASYQNKTVKEAHLGNIQTLAHSLLGVTIDNLHLNVNIKSPKEMDDFIEALTFISQNFPPSKT